MIWVNRSPHIISLLLLVFVNTTSLSFRQAAVKKSILDCPVDERTAIRFFYHDEEDYFHFPLIFRPAAQGDSRLDTAPMRSEGRTAYISIGEMQQLQRRLLLSNLPWQESEKVEVLGSYKRLQASDSMEILIVCSKGTARANVDPKKICETLARLDSVLKTPRSLWEFQLFRTGYACNIPGFNYNAYADHSH